MLRVYVHKMVKIIASKRKARFSSCSSNFTISLHCEKCSEWEKTRWTQNQIQFVLQEDSASRDIILSWNSRTPCNPILSPTILLYAAGLMDVAREGLRRPTRCIWIGLLDTYWVGLCRPMLTILLGYIWGKEHLNPFLGRNPNLKLGWHS